jgi:uncharacterized protein
MNNEAPEIEQQSIGQSILLHLLPGALAACVYIVTALLFMGQGYPSIMALYFPMILTVIALELGYMQCQARKQNTSLMSRTIIGFRERVPWWLYVVFPIGIVIWGVIVTGLATPIDNLVLNRYFGWLPDWYALRNLQQLPGLYSRDGLVLTAVLALIFNGIAGPVVEELYFRGYLMPRISRFGGWAPLINVLLFSLYHFWTPWQYFSRVLLLLPLVYGVWWKRNIYMGMVAHCLINLIGAALTFGQLLR